MEISRRDVIEAVKATEPEGTPEEYRDAVICKLAVPDSVFSWPRLLEPTWGAYWTDLDGNCGFVSRIILNDTTAFLSTDSLGRDRRLPIGGKRFFALPQPKGG